MSAAVDAGDGNSRSSRGYFDHDADVGVYGRGARIEDALVGAAEATFDLMTDIAMVVPIERIEVEFEEAEADFALVTWLNALLASAHERGLALGRFALERHGAHWMGAAWGEAWREELPRGVDVKGATLTALSVRESAAGWEARCVVDV